MTDEPGDPNRAAVEAHWAAWQQGDQERGHRIYDAAVVVEWPQSAERVVGLANLRALRASHPDRLGGFVPRRILGGGDLFVTEYVIVYDDRPVHTVSIMEFRDGKVTRETHYFADPFDPPLWRSRWVERMDESR